MNILKEIYAPQNLIKKLRLLYSDASKAQIIVHEWGTLVSILSQMIATCEIDAVTLGEKPKNKVFTLQSIFNYVQ